MPIFCQNCKSLIDELKDVDSQRQPCPVCGSVNRHYDDSVTSECTPGAVVHTKGYAGGMSRKKGLLFESKDGDSYSVSLGRFVELNQLVDHKEERYRKRVVDPLTGKILRDVDEPLSDHQGRGSAKRHDK